MSPIYTRLPKAHDKRHTDYVIKRGDLADFGSGYLLRHECVIMIRQPVWDCIFGLKI
jgi:hypothetical protein